MPERPGGYDVGILGAGAVGCAIAYALARRGVAAVVLDQGGAGSGATGAASARVWTQSEAPAASALLCRRSAERFPLLQEEIGPIEYLRTGGLAPALTEDQAAAGRDLADRQHAAGLEVRWLPRDEVLRREPALSPSVLGATYSPHDGAVNPFLLVRRLISAARRLGGAFLLHCGYVTLGTRAGGFVVRSAHGEVEVRRLVLAAGLGILEAARQLGVALPLSPVRRHVLVTEKCPPLLRHTLARARQQLTGEVLAESAVEDASRESTVSLETVQEVARSAAALIPALAGARVIRAFAGVRAVPEDGRPIAGQVEEGLYVAAAPCGITLCPLLGDTMADLLAGGRLPDAWEAWSPQRFRPLPGPAGGRA